MPAVMKNASWTLLFCAWLVAMTASLGALFVGEVMGQRPCDLCWHQRAFMFPSAVILTVAIIVEDPGVWRYALPLSLVGIALAGFHTLLYAGLVPKSVEPCARGVSCSDAAMTILGGVPLPALSLIAFVLLAALLLLARKFST
jgi:disulfide bond formation protein DsbB